MTLTTITLLVVCRLVVNEAGDHALNAVILATNCLICVDRKMLHRFSTHLIQMLQRN